MQAPFYDEVHGLALDIVNASSNDDEASAVEAYEKLKQLCEANEGNDLDHPLQWEALGDFSNNPEAAMGAYKKGLACALRFNLREYTASIKFAMAESHHQQENFVEAIKFAKEAKVQADKMDDSELQAAIDGFLDEIDGA